MMTIEIKVNGKIIKEYKAQRTEHLVENPKLHTYKEVYRYRVTSGKTQYYLYHRYKDGAVVLASMILEEETDKGRC